jgi:hypothetical protein
MQARVIYAPDRIEVSFPEPPEWGVRQWLKAWRFRFDGSRWLRTPDLSPRFLDEIELYRSVEWRFFLERDGRLIPARVDRPYMRSPKLVEDPEAASAPEAEPEAEPAAAPATAPAAGHETEREVREIRARRCYECGALVAVDPREQAELARRQREAVERAVEELRARGEPPYLASAPVPEKVKVVSHYLCRACREG